MASRELTKACPAGTHGALTRCPSPEQDGGDSERQPVEAAPGEVADLVARYADDPALFAPEFRGIADARAQQEKTGMSGTSSSRRLKSVAYLKREREGMMRASGKESVFQTERWRSMDLGTSPPEAQNAQGETSLGNGVGFLAGAAALALRRCAVRRQSA